MSNESEYPLSGQCQCGNINYRLLAPPKAIVACHCRECQKLSTSAFSITAVVNADDLVVTGEMATWERLADSGNISVAKFCPTCGNRILHLDPKKPEMIKLKPSTLADTRIINPTMHVWVCAKQDWYEIPECVDVHQRQPVL